jgi:hypothetical protein
MGQARRLRAICLHAALIALAVQGVTPDGGDLASPWLFDRVLDPVAANGSPRSGPDDHVPGGGAVSLDAADMPAGPETADEAPHETPDEVFAPDHPAPPLFLCRKRDGHNLLWLKPADLFGRPWPDPIRTPARRAVAAARGVRLTVSLCRLTC